MDKSTHINELLSYLCFYLHNSNVDNIRRTVLTFYNQDDILNSKKILWTLGSEFLETYKDRKNTEKRSSTEANLQDIIDALLVLDSCDKLPVFVARELNKIPDRQPEELNVFSLINRVARLEKKLYEYEETMIMHECSLKNIEKLNIDDKLEQFSKEVKLLTLAKRNEFSTEENISKMNSNILSTPSSSKNEENDHESNMHSDDWETISESSNSTEFKQKKTYKNILMKINNSYRGKKNKITTQQNKKIKSTSRTSNISTSSPLVDEDGFHIVESKARRRRRTKIQNIDDFQGMKPRMKNIFICNIVSGNESIIRKYIENKNIEVLDIVKVSHSNAKLKSFKISILENNLGTVLNNNFWPNGVTCRLWKNKEQKLFINSNFLNNNSTESRRIGWRD